MFILRYNFFSLEFPFKCLCSAGWHHVVVACTAATEIHITCHTVNSSQAKSSTSHNDQIGGQLVTSQLVTVT